MNLHRYSENLNCRSRLKTSRKRGLGQSGQIVVEYVLLLVVAVSLAALITKTMVNPDSGFVISLWSRVINAVGTDLADDANQ